MGAPLARSEAEWLAMPLHRPEILIVTTQAPLAIAVRSGLGPEHTYRLSPSREAAIELCHTRLPDLILIDRSLPDEDALELCRQLQRAVATADVPLILVLNEPGAETETEALHAGAADFVCMPLNAAVLRARVRTQLQLRFKTASLLRLSRRDGLTGVANRRHFDEFLVKEWRRCMRSESSLALILIGVDFFGRYNDGYGHPMGDACLQAIARTLVDQLNRPQDIVARFGNDKFACLLPETPLNGAWLRAVEMESAVRALEIVHEGSEIANVVTISLGVVATEPISGGDANSLVTAANEQLQRAKLAGRGQVQGEAI